MFLQSFSLFQCTSDWLFAKVIPNGSSFALPSPAYSLTCPLEISPQPLKNILFNQSRALLIEGLDRFCQDNTCLITGVRQITMCADNPILRQHYSATVRSSETSAQKAHVKISKSSKVHMFKFTRFVLCGFYFRVLVMDHEIVKIRSSQIFPLYGMEFSLWTKM